MTQKFGSITELIVTFSECLAALTPYMSKLGIEWKEPNNYDDWDNIAAEIYSSVVVRSVAYTVEGEYFARLPPYDTVLPNYGDTSFLFSPQFGREAVFLKLESSDMPFDTAVFCRLSPDGRPTKARERGLIRQLQFGALLKSDDEQREIVRVVLVED
jgi:hypothetical protein